MQRLRVEQVPEPGNMSEELSGVTVVIIIGMGVLLFILLFIFAKRQIMRFTLRSRRGPHVPIGHDASKVLKREIERRIELIPRIICEPQLMSKADPRYILYPGQQIPSHYYRLKAVDDVKLLEKEIQRQDSNLNRHPSENLRAYLLTALALALSGSDQQRLVHQFCDLYEHARHDPNHFGDEEYQQYSRLLLKLIDATKLMKVYSSRKSSPNRTPQHRAGDKHRNPLDPSRLRPPAPSTDNEEVLSVSDSRPGTLSVIMSSVDNETSV